MTRVILVRHAQASFGAENYDELSDLGKQQAEVSAKFLDTLDASQLVSGSLRRHRQTAAAMRSHTPVVDSDWNEFDYIDVIRAIRPDLDSHGAVIAALRDHPEPHKAFQSLYLDAVERWASGEHDGDYIESRRAFCDRVLSALSRAAQLGTRVVAFTSGGPISVVVQRALDLQEPATRQIEAVLANASVTTLSVRDDSLRLISFNSHFHLESNDGLVTFR